jgi:cyanoexosortase B-associated protein
MNDSSPSQTNTIDRIESIGKKQALRGILLLVLIVLLLLGAAPSYLSNNWSWKNIPTVANIKQVKRLLSHGIQLPDWNTYTRLSTDVGSHRWSVQLIGKTPEEPILLFLRPQTDYQEKLDKLAKPEVDWEDIQGYTKKFASNGDRWVMDLTLQLLEQRFAEKLALSPPNPPNQDGANNLKQEFNKALDQWFQQQFIAEYERRSQQSFVDNFQKPLEQSLGISFSTWLDRQLKSSLEWGFSAWVKEYFAQSHRDSERDLQFSANNGSQSVRVKARLFRAWNDKQTFAVVQWYARPDGGDYSVLSWFVKDQIAQLQDQRIPWVAVCLKIPIEPLGEIDRVETKIKALATQVQQSLMETAFTPSADKKTE